MDELLHFAEEVCPIWERLVHDCQAVVCDAGPDGVDGGQSTGRQYVHAIVHGGLSVDAAMKQKGQRVIKS